MLPYSCNVEEWGVGWVSIGDVRTINSPRRNVERQRGGDMGNSAGCVFFGAGEGGRRRLVLQ